MLAGSPVKGRADPGAEPWQSGAEGLPARNISARHGSGEGRLVRAFPGSADATILGGLRKIIGYGTARPITAACRPYGNTLGGNTLVVAAIGVNRRPMGTINMSGLRRRGWRA